MSAPHTVQGDLVIWEVYTQDVVLTIFGFLSLSFLSFLSYFIFLFSSCYGSSNPCLLVQEVREQDAYPGLISTLGTNYSLLSAESS